MVEEAPQSWSQEQYVTNTKYHAKEFDPYSFYGGRWKNYHLNPHLKYLRGILPTLHSIPPSSPPATVYSRVRAPSDTWLQLEQAANPATPQHRHRRRRRTPPPRGRNPASKGTRRYRNDTCRSSPSHSIESRPKWHMILIVSANSFDK